MNLPSEPLPGAFQGIDFPTRPTSNIYISQRLRLHYLDWGNEKAPPLLLLHGGRDHAHSWDWVANELQKDWHIIAPDLRGHGDSAWSPGGAYLMPYFLYDLAQLIRQMGWQDLSIVAHSFGGGIALRYAGIFPEKIRRLAVIEGLGLPPARLAEWENTTVDVRFRNWFEEQRSSGSRAPKRYETVEQALSRMRTENAHLSPAQARHLTLHGISQNEDGSYSWKFDNYIRSFPPTDISTKERHALWANISCPVLLLNGRNSWAADPVETGDVKHFQNVRTAMFENAGHWPHHDQFTLFIKEIKAFL